MAGFVDLTGWPDREPAGPFGAYTDFIAPWFLLTALLAALDHRNRTGEGQHLDQAQVEAGIQILGPALLDYDANGRVQTRRGNEDDSRIHKIRPDGTHSSFLGATCTGNCLSDGLPAWSPSGRRIAFQRTMGPELGQSNLIAIFVLQTSHEYLRSSSHMRSSA